MNAGQEHTPARPGHGREDQYWHNPILHLSACLAVGALVILVIFAINWLT